MNPVAGHAGQTHLHDSQAGRPAHKKHGLLGSKSCFQTYFLFSSPGKWSNLTTLLGTSPYPNPGCLARIWVDEAFRTSRNRVGYVFLVPGVEGNFFATGLKPPIFYIFWVVCALMPNHPVLMGVSHRSDRREETCHGRKSCLKRGRSGKVRKSESQDCHEWLKRHRKSFLSSKIVAMLEAAESSKQQMVGGIVTHWRYDGVGWYVNESY